MVVHGNVIASGVGDIMMSFLRQYFFGIYWTCCSSFLFMMWPSAKSNSRHENAGNAPYKRNWKLFGLFLRKGLVEAFAIKNTSCVIHASLAYHPFKSWTCPRAIDLKRLRHISRPMLRWEKSYPSSARIYIKKNSGMREMGYGFCDMGHVVSLYVDRILHAVSGSLWELGVEDLEAANLTIWMTFRPLQLEMGPGSLKLNAEVRL